MKQYSTFFETIHDETAPTGYLGRGTHYTILRAVVFHDENGAPCPGTNFDFAATWDEDHDERVIQAVERCYRTRILSSLVAIGERKGFLNAVLAPGLSASRITLVSRELGAIATKAAVECTQGEWATVEFWESTVGSLDQPGGIIDDSAADVSLYIKNLRMLWDLGLSRRGNIDHRYDYPLEDRYRLAQLKSADNSLNSVSAYHDGLPCSARH